MKKTSFNYLKEKYSLSDIDIQIIEHGIEIFLSDGANILTAIVVSCLTSNFYKGFIYIVTFSSLRIHSGGWHSATKSQCFISYQIVFSAMLILSTFSFPSILLTTVYTIAVIYTIINAPVEHIYNPLSDQERRKNRLAALKSLLFVSCLFVILLINKSEHVFTICFAVAWNAICMRLLKRSKYWREHGNKVCNS